jgi:hypothetical protein
LVVTAAWWDDLPDGSVVRADRGEFGKAVVLDRFAGKWWWGAKEFDTRQLAWVDVTVIHIPVTDAEPPPASIVMTGPESYWENARPQNLRPWADPWDLGSQRKSWADLRPRVTRILRWGPA